MYFDKTADQLLQCKVCGDDTTLHCMRCHEPYCSKACQRLDWIPKKVPGNRFGDHKVVCSKLAGPYNELGAAAQDATTEDAHTSAPAFGAAGKTLVVAPFLD